MVSDTERDVERDIHMWPEAVLDLDKMAQHVQNLLHLRNFYDQMELAQNSFSW